MEGGGDKLEEKYLQPIKQNSRLRSTDDYMVNHINLDPTAFLNATRYQISNRSNNVEKEGLESLIPDNKQIDGKSGPASLTSEG